MILLTVPACSTDRLNLIITKKYFGKRNSKKLNLWLKVAQIIILNCRQTATWQILIGFVSRGVVTIKFAKKQKETQNYTAF